MFIVSILSMLNSCEIIDFSKIDEISDIEELPIYVLKRQDDLANSEAYVVAGDRTVYYSEGVGADDYKKKGKMSEEDYDEFISIFTTVINSQQEWGVGCGNLDTDDDGFYSFFSVYETNNVSTDEYFPYCKFNDNHNKLMDFFKSNI